MRRGCKGRKLGRTKKQREALMKSLVGSLILHEKITTTEAKAKELKPKIEKIIHLVFRAKKQQKQKMLIFRQLTRIMPERAARKIINNYWGKNEEKNAGFVRLSKIGRRKSDGSKMAVIELG